MFFMHKTGLFLLCKSNYETTNYVNLHKKNTTELLLTLFRFNVIILKYKTVFILQRTNERYR